jgi:hypothetical protein
METLTADRRVNHHRFSEHRFSRPARRPRRLAFEPLEDRCLLAVDPFNITGPASPVTTSTPTVTWEAAAGAETYDLAVATDPSVTNVVQSFSDLTATSQPLAPLVDGTYYVGVTAVGDNEDPVVDAGPDQTIVLGQPFSGTGSFVDPPRATADATNNGFSFTIQALVAPGPFSILGPSGIPSTWPPTVTWEASAGADTYDLVVLTNPDLSSPVQAFVGLTGTSQQLAAVDDGVYYVGVSAINAAGSTAASNDGLSFILDTVPPVLSLTSPVHGLVTNQNVTVAGQATDSGAGLVSLELQLDGPFEPIPFDSNGNFSTLTTLPLDGSADGPHTVTVQAVDAAGNAATVSSSFTLITVPPGAFDITGPPSPVTTSTPIVTWEASSGAESYQVVVASDAGLSNPVLMFGDLTSTSLLLDPLADGVYYVGVTAVNVAGPTDAANNGLSFEVITVEPDPFNILGPSGFIFTDTPTVEWQASAGATTYDLVIATDPNGTSPVQVFNDLTGTSQVLAPLAEGTYYSLVTAENAAGSTLAANNGFTFLAEEAQLLSHTIFVTSTPTLIEAGNVFPPQNWPFFSGTAGADWGVTYQAYQAGLIPEPWDGVSIVWKAVLSTPYESAQNRINLQGPIINTQGELIAISVVELFDGSIDTPILYDEYGNPVTTYTTVYTGSLSNGLYSGFSAGNFDDPLGVVTVGSALASNGTWLDLATQSASTPARLYGISPPQLWVEGGPAETPIVGGEATEALVDAALDEALAYWANAGADPARLAQAAEIELVIADLPGSRLGLAALGVNQIVVDLDAAGYGWSLDVGQDPARVHLPSALAHELGHALGIGDEPAPHANPMAATLPPGTNTLAPP